LMWALSTVFVIGRFISRGAIVKRILRDDYIIGLAWTIATGLSIGVCLAAANGLGRHERNVPSDWTRTLRKAIYAVSIMYQPALMTTKTSILIEHHLVIMWHTSPVVHPSHYILLTNNH